jgi:putative proteasome-type protease
MTYCLAVKLDEGLVFCSDSRTNAGPDRVSTYSKMHRFSCHGDRQVAILTAGNLGTTQAVIATLERDLKHDAGFNLSKAEYISDIADYVGENSVKVQQKYASSGPEAGFNASATFIVGGQTKGNDPELYLIYPEGNHITCSDRHPFLQIGEIKYGKPILDRIIRSHTAHEIAMRCTLVSMDSTMRSNATVGPPIELLFLQRDELKSPAYYRSFRENDDYLLALRRSWDENIRRAFNDLPPLDYADGADG